MKGSTEHLQWLFSKNMVFAQIFEGESFLLFRIEFDGTNDHSSLLGNAPLISSTESDSCVVFTSVFVAPHPQLFTSMRRSECVLSVV